MLIAAVARVVGDGEDLPEDDDVLRRHGLVLEVQDDAARAPCA